MIEKINQVMGKLIVIELLSIILLFWGCQDNQLQVYETIQEAAEKGDLEDVKRHLKRGANVNSKNYAHDHTRGLTALHVAAGNGHKEIVALLIEKGAVVNAKAQDDITPLHWAVAKGFNKDTIGDYKGVVGLLIANSADMKAKTNINRGDGGTPMHFAIRTGDKELVSLLIAKGADVNAKDVVGYTPLKWASSQSMIDLLEKHGAKREDGETDKFRRLEVVIR